MSNMTKLFMNPFNIIFNGFTFFSNLLHFHEYISFDFYDSVVKIIKPIFQLFTELCDFITSLHNLDFRWFQKGQKLFHFFKKLLLALRNLIHNQIIDVLSIFCDQIINVNLKFFVLFCYGFPQLDHILHDCIL